MLKKILLASGVAAVSLVAAGNTYKVSILEDTVLAGQQLKAGDYKVELEGGNAILKHGKKSVTVPAHSEQAQAKYANTQVQYVNNAIHEIHIGGTTTKIVFTPANGANAGGGMN